MKKHANPKVSDPSDGAGTPSAPVEPAPGAEALNPSEITLVFPDSHEASFDPLPKDFAPTRTVPETDQPIHPPEYRSPAESEGSTLAIPIKDLNQAKTANIAPLLQTGTTSEAWGTVSMPSPADSSTPPRKSSGISRNRWLGLGAGVLLVLGAATWFLWPKNESQAMESSEEPAKVSTQTAPEAVPPELRTYMDQAKAGNAWAMNMIAVMYWNGLNVSQDRVKGMEWYRKAAAAGSTAAQQFLKDNGGK